VREYETTFIVQPEISDEARDTLLGKLDGLLERGGALRLMLDDWGKRKLAYEIENFQKGHYYSLKYLDEGKVVSDLERTLRLDEAVLRYLTVRVAEVVEDVEQRRTDAAEEERKQRERLEAERAAREEEERARREAEAQAAAEAQKAAAEAEASGEGASTDEGSSDDDDRSGEEE
jgi:small subunit ribosomal protein S6